MLTRLRSAYFRFRSFIQVYFGLLAILWKDKKIEFMAATFLGLFGTVCVVATVAITVSYLTSMSTGNTSSISFAKISVSLPGAHKGLYIVSAVCFLLFIFGALATYHAAFMSRKLGRHVHGELVCRVINQFSQSLASDILFKNHGIRSFQLMISRDALQSGIAIQNIVGSLQPASYFLLGLTAATWLQPSYIAMLVPLLVLLSPLIFLQSSRINHNSQQFHSQAVDRYGMAVSNLAHDLNRSNVFEKNMAFNNLNQYEKHLDVTEYFDRYDEFLLGGPSMLRLTSMFKAVVFTTLLLATGNSALNGSIEWGRLVGFFIALGFMLNGLNSLVNYLANLNRFYPQISQIYRFLKRSSPIQPSMLSKETLELCDVSGQPNTSIFIKKNCPIYLYTGFPLSRVNIGTRLLSIFHHNSSNQLEGDIVFANGTASLATSRQNWRSKYYLEIESQLINEPFYPVLSKLPDVFSSEAWDSLPNNIKKFLLFISLLHYSNKIIIVDSQIIDSVKSINNDFIGRLSSSNYLIFWLESNKSTLQIPDINVLVAQEDQKTKLLSQSEFLAILPELSEHNQTQKTDDQSDPMLTSLL